jgi:hypothetical protein
MSDLVIDRALNPIRRAVWPRWEEMLGIGAAGVLVSSQRSVANVNERDRTWHSLLRPDVELRPRLYRGVCGLDARAKLTFGDRVHCPFLRPFFLTESDESRMRVAAETIAALGERVIAGGAAVARAVQSAGTD